MKFIPEKQRYAEEKAMVKPPKGARYKRRGYGQKITNLAKVPVFVP